MNFKEVNLHVDKTIQEVVYPLLKNIADLRDVFHVHNRLKYLVMLFTGLSLNNIV